MVNEARGEIKIKLGDAEHVLRPTYKVLAEIEGKLGGLLGLAKKFSDQEFTLTDVTTIIVACMREITPENGNINEEEVGQAIIKEGMISLVKPIADFLEMPLFGLTEKIDENTAKNG